MTTSRKTTRKQARDDTARKEAQENAARKQAVDCARKKDVEVSALFAVVRTFLHGGMPDIVPTTPTKETQQKQKAAVQTSVGSKRGKTSSKPNDPAQTDDDNMPAESLPYNAMTHPQFRFLLLEIEEEKKIEAKHTSKSFNDAASN